MALVIVKLHESDHSSLDSPSEEEICFNFSLLCICSSCFHMGTIFSMCIRGGVSKATATRWPQKLSGNFLDPWAACREVCICLLQSFLVPLVILRTPPADPPSLPGGIKTQTSLTCKKPTGILKLSAEEQWVNGKKFIVLLFLFYLLHRCRGIDSHELSS